MTSDDDQVFLYYRSPEAIRNEAFTRRRRGLDPDEVNEYLSLLADQMEAFSRERREIRAENDRLQVANDRLETENEQHRADTQRLQAELQGVRSQLVESEGVGDRVNEQVVELFSQAQLVAEEIVEDVTRDARERLGQARAQERQILEEAMQTAERTRREAEAMIATTVSGAGFGRPSNLSPAGGDVEQVRSFARTAQAQMQSIMDAFASQVAQLGDPLGGGSARPAPYLNGSTSPDVRGWQIEGPRGNDRDPGGAA